MNTIQRLRHRNPFRQYDFRRLINTRELEPYGQVDEHIICDIDKTYLETNTEGAIQMLKIAFEDAKDKVTVAGASPFLIAARWGNPFHLCQDPEHFHPRSLHFVSASPPQLRATLEDKLIQDGLDWNSDSFKNQAYNLRKGRLGLLRHHVAYKSTTMLRIMQGVRAGSRFYLIGDNAEFDAYIYLGLSLYLKSKLSADAYEQFLCAGGVQTQVAADIRSLMDKKPDVEVAGILIRNAPGFHMPGRPPLTSPIVQFDNYYEALLIMIKWGMVEISALSRLTREFHNRHSFSRERLLACLSAAETTLFPGEPEILKILGQEIQTLKKIGPLQQVPEPKPFKPPFTVDDIDMTEDELLHESRLFAEQLTNPALDQEEFPTK